MRLIAAILLLSLTGTAAFGGDKARKTTVVQMTSNIQVVSLCHLKLRTNPLLVQR
jgi:hypothetical protein